jgi:hypothetical protein
MLPPMHPDDAGLDRLDNPTDDNDHAAAQQSLWWALHRPETYALSALVLAAIALTQLLPSFEISQAWEVGDGNSFRGTLGLSAGLRLAVAVGAVVLAGLAIRTEDEDVTWSAPVARAALVVAVVAILFALAALLGVLTHDGTPDGF